jgi:hypothetical protein
MTPDIDILIDRTPAEKAIRVESLRVELLGLGYEVVSTDWLRRLDEAIQKRKVEVSQ